MMNEKETPAQKKERQTQEIHAALGRYVESFEQLVMWIRVGCGQLTCMLAPGRAGVKQQQLMNVVFHHNCMTASNLFAIYRALVGQIVNDPDAAIDQQEAETIEGVLRYFSKAFQDATNMRNDYIHGTWFIGHGNQDADDWSQIAFMRGKATTEGLQFLSGPKDATAVDTATAECKRLTDYFTRFSAVFFVSLSHKTFRVSNNFVKVGKKEWKPKEPAS